MCRRTISRALLAGLAGLIVACDATEVPSASSRPGVDLVTASPELIGAARAALPIGVTVATQGLANLDWANAGAFDDSEGVIAVGVPLRSDQGAMIGAVGVVIGGPERRIVRVDLLEAREDGARIRETDVGTGDFRLIRTDAGGGVVQIEEYGRDGGVMDLRRPIHPAYTCGELQDRISDKQSDYDGLAASFVATGVAANTALVSAIVSPPPSDVIGGFSYVATLGYAAYVGSQMNSTNKQLQNMRKDFHAHCVYDPSRGY